ncbi:MAG: NAD(P)-dependent glycerol-3-phosphate dehydrogenase [Clostridia bacterium]|nr:NAD(P)-dependent glycerol-3-phosphate dehydrogenase [Clostridia bacterium]MBO5982491.1 NAD(P)-dependent glycerol-3-phosphate dehydrogenase [Clostridia bacterium]MBO7151688.1 NAD(P)-dependent glycerol-3-phosphate dehydrogenase [Clostridia bacterium]
MLDKAKVGVLGAGTWGIALARLLSNAGHDVTVWSAVESEIDTLSTTRKHPNLPGVELPECMAYTKDIKDACEGKDMLVFAVPSVFVRATARKAKPYISDGQIIVDVAKGIEEDTLLTMTGIIADEIKNPTIKLVALSGPTHAEEVIKDLPTTIISASADLPTAEEVQKVFNTERMRVYTNEDIHGVELCGALKNIIALASGIATGLGCGDNAKAALITRGIVEIGRLGMAMGCKEHTFNGLAGIGDIIVTATSIHSRNNRCGMLIGQGVPVADAIKQVGMVVEGLNALPAAMALAKKHNVEMPIVETVYSVVSGKANVTAAIDLLMSRELKSESTDQAN